MMVQAEQHLQIQMSWATRAIRRKLNSKHTSEQDGSVQSGQGQGQSDTGNS